MEANILNVRDLPQAQEVVQGDYIILEDKTGTKIIDFRDFVIGPRNTSFYNALVTNINIVSTFGIRLSGALQSSASNILKGVKTEFNTLTADFARRNPLWFIYSDTVTVPTNSKVGARTFFVDSVVGDISISDITISQVPTPSINPYVNPVVGRVNAQELVYDNTGTTIIGTLWTLGLTAANTANTDIDYQFKVVTPYFLAF